MRVLIVDDEAPARSELRYLLDAHPAVEVAGEAANAPEALALVKAIEPDAVFLDVEMPGLSGIAAAQLVRGQAEPPAIVFVTAHGEYAVEAFAVEAFDYVLKPVDPERLARVVERLSEVRRLPRDERKIPVVAAAGGSELLDQEQVCFVQAEGDYCRVHTFDRSYLSTSSLRDLEAALPAERFVRIHRSYIVNLAKVSSVKPASGDRLKLSLDDAQKTELEVARRQVARVRAALKLG